MRAKHFLLEETVLHFPHAQISFLCQLFFILALWFVLHGVLPRWKVGVMLLWVTRILIPVLQTLEGKRVIRK